MTVNHPILIEAGFDQAVDYVQGYFHDPGKSGRKYYTGAYFDTWAGGGDGATANELTSDDFVAVSMLSVFVPADAAVGLQEKANEIRGLLAALPVGLDFTDLNRAGFDRHLGPGSAAQELWDVLRSHGDPWGIGPTTASKLMARKRSALIPIYDSEVGPQMGLQNSALQWEKWFQVFQDDPGLGERLDRIGAKAGVPHISRLRIMDVALWRYAKDEHPDSAS
ncbi:hypothetical protein ASH00_14410 [Arthrobacter sp. Soil782]|uniref:DUF6308 family protein n=1 Tax=Arthrobacter sp. Soil782 TaxID=1736410 RepID=UPI0006FE2138|nr:DUF6308 family protein [Arthrobacter sp. Soil782]KRF04294.1 hypothetical protein ASH00_14410 [Arthrobacter sp. Soil782]